MFLNFTNHRSENWSETQRIEAEKYGEIVDMDFPDIDPILSAEEIWEFAEKYAREIAIKKPDVVLCQGEMNFAFAVVYILISLYDIPVVATSSCRVSTESSRNGVVKKSSEFSFEQFRRYIIKNTGG